MRTGEQKDQFEAISSEFSELMLEKEKIEAAFMTIDEFGVPCWKQGWRNRAYGRRYREITERLEVLNRAQGALIKL